MIRKAIERGVSEEKIALALDLNPRSIVRKAKLLDGICEEAVSILKDKHCATAVFEILRKMKAMRQIEAAELMMNANNYSPAYISAMARGFMRNSTSAPGPASAGDTSIIIRRAPTARTSRGPVSPQSRL